MNVLTAYKKPYSLTVSYLCWFKISSKLKEAIKTAKERTEAKLKEDQKMVTRLVNCKHSNTWFVSVHFIKLIIYKLLIMFLFSTSCGSSVEHQKRMLIICQRKKRRRGKSQRRRWRYLDLVSIPLDFPRQLSVPIALPLLVEQELSFFSYTLVIFWHKTLN